MIPHVTLNTRAENSALHHWNKLNLKIFPNRKVILIKLYYVTILRVLLFQSNNSSLGEQKLLLNGSVVLIKKIICIA